MTHRMNTQVTLTLAGGDERTMPVRIEYSRYEGSAPTSMDPGSDARVEIDRIMIVMPTGPVPSGWLEDVLRDDADLLGEVMQHWSDEDEAARERRDEDREQERRERVR